MSELNRYHRQMLLPDFGEAGQRRLLDSKLLLVGCGALGCTIADLLVRAGVGSITIVDRDVVELTNLQRQTLFDAEDAKEGMPKAEAAARRLSRVNGGVRIQPIVRDFTSRNAGRIVEDAGGSVVLLDGTDNFETRYLINDLAVKRGLPYVYGGAVATRGMAMTVLPGKTPCLRCIFEEPPGAGVAPTCDTVGVFGPVVTIVASCQASDAVKVMLGREDLVSRTLLDVDLWSNDRRRLEFAGPRGDCPCCGQRKFEFLEGERAGVSASLCGQDGVQIAPVAEGAIDLGALATRLAPHGTFRRLGSMLVRGTLDRERSDSGGVYSLTVFADGRAIIKGTTRPEAARSIYARYIGA